MIMRPGGEDGKTIQYYQNLWNTVGIRPECLEQAKQEVAKIQENRIHYQNAALSVSSNCPWELPGLIHAMECDSNMNCQILNGQRWDRVTTIAPIGKGPWNNWNEPTVEALRERNMHLWHDWGVPWLLRRLEGWNGFGYMLRLVRLGLAPMHSPYLWAGTNHYEKGLFVADGMFDTEKVSKQIGAAALYYLIHDIDAYRRPIA